MIGRKDGFAEHGLSFMSDSRFSATCSPGCLIYPYYFDQNYSVQNKSSISSGILIVQRFYHFVRPVYHLATLVKLSTAIVSVLKVISWVKTLPKLFPINKKKIDKERNRLIE
jgi:hypothetical protein